MEKLILALDCGTTSTRALAIDLQGRIRASAQYPITQYFPQPGQVEQDANELWTLTMKAAFEVMREVGPQIATIGLTNQRETICFWSKRTGEPLNRAIVWQDRRTAPQCEALRAQGVEALVQATTGLFLDPYFSATKARFAIDNSPELQAAEYSGDLAIGTVESWLTFKLTGDHLTDASNASRTLLMDLHSGQWSSDMLEIFRISGATLPAIAPTAGLLAQTKIFGSPLSITGMAGDQQAATIGQGCHLPGMAKCTYGTGIFLLANSGNTPKTSENRLISTYLTSNPLHYALEGSVFVGGSAIKWLRDSLGLLQTAAESEDVAKSVPDTAGVSFVPAFAGLGAPYWEPAARGTLVGLSSGTTKAHIVRATLEAMGEQTADLIDAFRADGVIPERLKVDGGMTANSWMCQDIADATGLIVERPRNIETTALGAALLAGVGIGLFKNLPEAAAEMAHAEQIFHPQITADQRAERRDRWHRAIRQTRAALPSTD